MIGSYVLYISLAIACWLLSALAVRYQKRSLVWLIILILTLISGLMRILRHPQLLLILFAGITNGCMILRFWELRKISSFACMVGCYYMTSYFMTMSGLRQFCAVALVFFFTRYLTQKKIFLFVLGVLLAMLLHQSAVVGLILLAVNCLRWKELAKSQKLFFIFAVLSIPVLVVAGVQLFARYAWYFAEIKMDLGLMVLLKMAFLLATLVYVFLFHRKLRYFAYQNSLDHQARFYIKLTAIGYFWHC